jgi:hypothetical protein
VFPLVGAARTVRSGPSEVRSELWSNSEFGLWGRTLGSDFDVGLWCQTLGGLHKYLVSKRIEESFKDNFEESRAKIFVVQISLAYLVHVEQGLFLKQIGMAFPFTQYSARYWIKHARSTEIKKTVQEMILKFFLEQKEAYAIWGCLFNPDNPWDELPLQGYKMATPLYYASLAGLVHTVNSLLKKGVDINVQSGFYSNALQATSQGGHEKLVQILLKKGADVNARGGEYGNALYAAS